MIPQPLHPALVHFPVVFAVLLPVVAVVALLVIRRGSGACNVWLPVVALSGVLAFSSWIAVQTGEAQEDIVEEVVSRSAIHEHEESAELVLILSFVTFLLAAGGLGNNRPGSMARVAATVLALGVLGAAFRAGHSGGELVYELGAAQAYTGPIAVSSGGEANGAEQGKVDRRVSEDRR